MKQKPPVRFGVVGVNHFHIHRQIACLREAGGTFVAFHAAEPDLAEAFGRAHPDARRVGDPRAILEDPSIDLLVTAAVPDQRARLGIEAMRHGKDVLADKPAFTDFDQLAEARAVQAETGRLFAVFFAERFESAATVEALRLVRSGAIGKVVQTVGLGPHRLGLAERPAWFFQPRHYGGILVDIASHQFDQLLAFTGSASAEIVAARVSNHANPRHPEFEDFGEALVRAGDAFGHVRVDWYTPDGLGVWGDGRLFVLGTDGYIEIRKVCDVAGRPGGDHLFLVDGRASRYVDCRHGPLPFGRRLLADIVERTQTALGQDHCFLVCDLALRAQAVARDSSSEPARRVLAGAAS